MLNEQHIYAHQTPHRRRHYGFWKFMGDCFLVAITGGLWLVWIFVREMRSR